MQHECALTKTELHSNTSFIINLIQQEIDAIHSLLRC
jgi:hypothetical protein